MKLYRSLFKAYDIRGIYATLLVEEIAYKIGRAYAKFILKENSKTKNISSSAAI